MAKIIAITGASGSGKTSVAHAIETALRGTKRVAILAEDNYYHDLGLKPGFDAAKCNYDEPAAKDYTKLYTHLAAFKAGQAVETPLYDHSIHACTGQTVLLDPKQLDVLIVEGIHVLWDENVRKCYDLKVYVDTPLDECLARRINRDIAERGRDVAEVLWRYRAHVRPGHYAFTAPTKAYADIVIEEAIDTPIENKLHQPVVDWCCQ